MKYREGLIYIFIVLEIFLSIYSIYESERGFSTCLSGFDCKTVQTSPFAYLFGIKLSWIGLIAFASLLLVYMASQRKIISKNLFLLATSLGAAGAVYFISIQAFILKVFCSSCMAIDLTMIILFSISLYDYYKNPSSEGFRFFKNFP